MQQNDWTKFKHLLGQGRFEFVLRSRVTGNAFTYKAKHKFGLVYVHYVNMKSKPLVCTLNMGLTTARRQQMSRGYMWGDALMWMLERVLTGQPIVSNVSWEHTGCCAKCGRPLTDPQSIEAGLGPICRGEKSV